MATEMEDDTLKSESPDILETMKENRKRDELLASLTKTKTKNQRYYDGMEEDAEPSMDADAINIESDEEEEESDNSDDENSDTSDKNSNDESSELKKSETEKKDISKFSAFELEKLLNKTMTSLALKLEQNNNQSNMQNEQKNPFTSQKDEIALQTSTQLDMNELLSFIPSDDDELIAPKDGQSLLPEANVFSSNHSLNLNQSKVTTTMSTNTFEREEERLAKRTLRHSITHRMNMESRNFALPLSSMDPRVRRKRKADNAGKRWFNMKAGKLTPDNKLHFLMLKYRHMLYRKHKPVKMKEDFVPKYFEIGTIIEGPTEWYSSRINKKERRSSWANEYLDNASTQQWLYEKTKRAQRRIRRPGRKFWAPLKKLNVNNRYKLRKKIQKRRKQAGSAINPRVKRRINKMI